MATSISALTAASGIDGANDYLAIDTASPNATNKINRNTLLGITGSPVGTSDSQALTNKTIGNTNTITAKDGSLTIQNSSDTTKQAVLSLSGITTGNTRTYTLPDASTTLVGTGTTQTLTAKTLTSPTITGGTIDNSTITVDSISGHTSGAIVTVGGVQMNNGQVGTANAVVTSSINDSAVTPAKLLTGTGSGWSWSSWTPTWTNLTPGNGTLSFAKYIQIGKTVFARLYFVFGNTTSVSGTITFSLPANMHGDYSDFTRVPEATVALRHIATSTTDFGNLIPVSASTIGIQSFGVNGTLISPSNTSATVPFTWVNPDIISLAFCYETP